MGVWDSMSKKTKVWLAVSLFVILVFSFAASLIQSNFGKTSVTYVRKGLADMITEINANNEAYGKDIEVSFGTASSAIVFGTAASSNIEFKMLVPKHASEKNRLPAIILAPGMDDMKDDLYTLYTELSRRGYVVVAVDKAGEGNSDLSADGYTNGSAGMEAIIEYVMSLPYVDEKRVGISGHSNGNKFLIIAMNRINLETRNHISAFLMGQGTGFHPRLQEGVLKDVKFGMIVGKNDEMDTVYFNSAFFDETDKAKDWIREIYPDFNGDAVPLGTWFTANGERPIAANEYLTETEARVLYNPPTTHPGMMFSRSGAKAYVDFFYNALGVPEGSDYIPSDNQICWLMVTFQLIAMLGYLSLVFPVFEILLNTETFRKLKADTIEAPASEFRNPREWIPTLILMIGMSAFAALSIFPLFRKGATLLPPTDLLPLSTNYMNQIVYWIIIVAIVTCAAVIVMHWIKKLLYRGTGILPESPFKCADITLREFLRSMLFAACLYALMCLPIIAVRLIFKVDFRISALKFTWYRPERIFVVLRYTMLFGLFYLMNSILTANTRFKDLPDWISTGIVSLGNSLGLIILQIVQYTALVNNHALRVSDMGSATIQVWKYFLPMLMAPVISRFIYNRTKNIWISTAFSAIFFNAVSIATTGITTSLGLFAL